MERRRVDPAIGQLGLAGLAILRLHALRDPGRAAECVAAMRRMLAEIDGEAPVEATTPMLDVADGYARWAAVYDAPGNPLIDCEEPVVRALLDQLVGDPLLDAACGTGRHLAYLADRGHRVIGIDVVPEMLEKAREKAPDADCRVGNLTNLPVADGEVRGLVCSLALDHVEDLSRVYAEFERVVAPGGAVVVSTMHPVLRSVFGWGAWFVDELGKTDIPTFEHRVADHLNAAADAGLVLTRCEEPEVVPSALPPDAPLTTRIAHTGLPMVLVLQFGRP